MSAVHPIERGLTLVIPTLGREILAQVLRAVEAGSAWPARLIIVDQGRRAEIASLAKAMRDRGLDVLYLPTGTRGKSVALNLGIAQVETRFVVLTDDDCEVAPDWIERMGARLRRHEPAIVTGRVDAGEGVQLSVVTSTAEVVQRRRALRFDRLSGGNMGLPLAAARRIGPFSELPSLRHAEDTEYAYRALRARVPIVYAPEIAVRHLAWRDQGERADRYRHYARSHAAFFGWYLRRGDKFMILRVAVHLLRSLKRWLAGVLRRDLEAARNGRAYVVELWPGLCEGWRAGGLP